MEHKTVGTHHRKSFAQTKLLEVMHSTDDQFAMARLFAALTIANLTMNESSGSIAAAEGVLAKEPPKEINVKAELLEKLKLDFFFFVRNEDLERLEHENILFSRAERHNVIPRRVSALCLSELFEHEDNRKLQGSIIEKKKLLSLLISLARFPDMATAERAVKALALLAECPENHDDLLYNGVLEAFYDASHNSENLQVLTLAWKGMTSLASDVSKLITYGSEGAPPDKRYVKVRF